MLTYHAYGVNSNLGAFRGHDCLAARGDMAYPTIAGLLDTRCVAGIDKEVSCRTY